MNGTHICLICGKEFKTNRRWQKCCSKECSIINNKEQEKKYNKEYRKENKEYQKEYYQEKRKEQTKERCKVDKEYKEKLTERRKRKIAKRERNLGFNPLNDDFDNSNAHHINNIDVIYIPKKLHISYAGHSVTRNRNMEPVNTVAFFFLMMQNIDRFRSF